MDSLETRKKSLETRIEAVLDPQSISYRFIGDFIGVKKSVIECNCGVCGNIYIVKDILGLLRHKTGCAKCKNKAKGLRNRTPLDIVNKKLAEVSQNRYTFEIIDFQTQAKSKIHCKCVKCNYIWVTNYNCLVRAKSGCPKCANKIMGQKAHENKRTPYNEVIARLQAILIHKGIEFELKEQDYYNVGSKVICYCAKHNHRWEATISSLIGTNKRGGTGCYKCGKEATAEKLKLSQQQVETKLIKEANGEFAFMPFKYINMYQKIECVCTNKQHRWVAKISDLIHNHSKCPYCVFAKGSPQEKELLDYIKPLICYEIIENTRALIPPYEIDIYIPALKLAFEYNGEYWHSDRVITKKRKFASAQQYHDYKTAECAKLGIKLIHIDEKEWLNNRKDVLYMIKNYICQAMCEITPQTRKLEKLKRKYKELEFLTDYKDTAQNITVRYRDKRCAHIWGVSPSLLNKGYRRECPYCKKDKSLIEFLQSFNIEFKSKGSIFEFSKLMININTDNIAPQTLIDMTDKYKAKGKYIIHIFKHEWQCERDKVKSAIERILLGHYKTNALIQPYHLYPDFERISQPAETAHGVYDCGKAYINNKAQECRQRVSEYLDELQVQYTKDNNIFNTDRLEIRLIPVVDYQKYKTNDLNRLVNQAQKRTMLIFETQLTQNEHQWQVIKSNIAQALGKTKHRVYARNLECVKVEPKSLKEFFENNHQYGYTSAQDAFALIDEKGEVYMAYMLKAGYHKTADTAIVRGACKLNHSIVGGVTKIWKQIITDCKNKEQSSIVYYADLNIHNGNSIDFLGAERVATHRGLWNFWFDNAELKNRVPSRYKEIKKLEIKGYCMEVYNAGTRTYIYRIP